MRSGWFNDSFKHSLASRGIQSKKYLATKSYFSPIDLEFERRSAERATKINELIAQRKAENASFGLVPARTPRVFRNYDSVSDSLLAATTLQRKYPDLRKYEPKYLADLIKSGKINPASPNVDQIAERYSREISNEILSEREERKVNQALTQELADMQPNSQPAQFVFQFEGEDQFVPQNAQNINFLTSEMLATPEPLVKPNSFDFDSMIAELRKQRPISKRAVKMLNSTTPAPLDEDLLEVQLAEANKNIATSFASIEAQNKLRIESPQTINLNSPKLKSVKRQKNSVLYSNLPSTPGYKLSPAGRAIADAREARMKAARDAIVDDEPFDGVQ